MPSIGRIKGYSTGTVERILSRRLFGVEQTGMPTNHAFSYIINPEYVVQHIPQRAAIDFAPPQPAAISLSSKSQAIKIPEMIPIVKPGTKGVFQMGDKGMSHKVRKVTLTMPYSIGKYPVTNEEFQVFLSENGYNIPDQLAELSLSRYPIELQKCTASEWKLWIKRVNQRLKKLVTEEERRMAENYTLWLSEVTGRSFRLPTEAEWEYAARGPESFIYPWGNKFDISKGIYKTGGTSSVDSHPEGASPFGVMHMSGNVWELVDDFDGLYDSKLLELTDPRVPNGHCKLLRGGDCSKDTVLIEYRSAYRTFTSYARKFWTWREVPPVISFRIAEDLK